MRIALDYDETYTRDPVLWNGFCRAAMARGHEIWCVSLRHPDHMEEVVLTLGQVIGASRCIGTDARDKREAHWAQAGVYIDVWIDDSPEFIGGVNVLRGQARADVPENVGAEIASRWAEDVV